MKRLNHKKNLYKSIILLVILVIGIGYAYLTSNLSITGATEVVANTWDIHFENLNISTGSVTASTPATIQSNNVDITYTITLSRPKEYYEFTVDVKNDGTLPGKVSISSLSGLDTTSSKVIDYSITYTNGNSVNIGDIINAGTKKTIKVRVYYKDDISESDFPSSNLNLTLTYTLQYVQSEEEAPTTDAIIQDLKTNQTSCFTKYSGDVTDSVGNTTSATKVYFNKCLDKRNIKFAGYCWQMIRTTETGGIKMIYNGEPEEGKCLNTRGNHLGIVQNSYATVDSNSIYMYGSSFRYNISSNQFTLVDTTTSTWSDSTYENLLGKFTCMNTTGTCTTLYNANGYYSNTEAYLSNYSIKPTNYAQIGTSSFNSYMYSPSMIGYMFNKVYNNKNETPSSSSLKGNDVSYSNGTYTLLPANGESELGTTKDNTHHYTCNTTSPTCNIVRYYFYKNRYIELNGEDNVEKAINNMFYDDNVNNKNSSIKGYIEAWYAQNMADKNDLLEDIVYCNDRSISNISTSGWDKNGDLNTPLTFEESPLTTSLACEKITDQFSVNNTKAKLTYPVGLLIDAERMNINNSSLMATGDWWWVMSPSGFYNGSAGGRRVTTNGDTSAANINYDFGVRPVISLKNGAIVSQGDGSESDPWVVE